MSEVRPWIGSYMSCGYFKTTRDLKIIDCSMYHSTKNFLIYFREPGQENRDKAVWTNIDQAFSEPVTLEDDTADYVPTQVIAELFKSEGYDGIAYKSAFGDEGYNIVLFDLDAVKIVSCQLHKVETAEFSFVELGNPYWVEKDGTIKTITVEVLTKDEARRP